MPEEFTYHLPYDEMNQDWMSLKDYQIEVNPVVNNAKATYKVIRPENEEKIIIEVTAENGNKKTYTINFKKVNYYGISQYTNDLGYPKPGEEIVYNFKFNSIKTGEVQPDNVVLGIRYSDGPENGKVTIDYNGQTIEISKEETKFITLSDFPEELQLPVKYDADGIYELNVFLEDMDAVPLSNQISWNEIIVEKVYNFVEPTITIDNSFTFKKMDVLPDSFPGTDAIKDIKPVAVTLSTGGTGVSYNNVRLEVNVFKDGQEYKDIQLWAFDGNDWHDIVKEGWGPSEGFTLPANYNVTTYVYPIVKDYGDYSLSVVLFDVEKPFEWFENYKYPVAGAGGNYRLTENAKFRLETEDGFFNFALKQPLFEEKQYGGAMNNNEIDSFIGQNSLQPIDVSIVPDSIDGIYVIEEKGYDAARIVVDSVYMKDNEGNYTIPAEDKIQLWAKDTSGNWYNIVHSGWGPPTGFALTPYYQATTPVYVIVYELGEYRLTARLYDVNTGETLSELSKEYDLTHIYSTYEISFEGTGNVLFSPLLSSENIEQNIESTPELVPIQFEIKPVTVGDLSYDKGVVEVNVYDKNGSLANDKVQLWIKDAEGKWLNLVDGIETINALAPDYNVVLDVYAVANEVGDYRIEAALYGMEGENKRLLSTSETHMSLHDMQSLYDIEIPGEFTCFNGTLIEETNGIPNSNQAVDDYIYQNDLSPVPITLEAVAIGDRGYDAVRLTVSAYVYDETNGWVDASDILQIWAKILRITGTT